MAISFVGLDTARANKKFRATLRGTWTDLFAGAICSILSISYSLSYAVLIFGGGGDHLLALGVAITLLSAAVGGAVVAWRSSLPFAVAGPDSSISVVLAGLVASLSGAIGTGGGSHLAEATVFVLSSTTLLTGLFLCVLGFTHAGHAIRFVPYPVIGGFLGATGLLMIVGAVDIVAGRPPAVDNLAGFLQATVAGQVAAAVLMALVLHLVMSVARNVYLFPAALLGATGLAHLVLQLSGVSLAAAQATGWLFQPPPAAMPAMPWSFAELSHIPWAALPSLAGGAVAAMFVTAVTFLLNTTGIEIATHSEANVGRDLKVLGLANIVTAALGGLVNCTSLSRTTLVRLVGATGRLTGFTVAAICGAVLLIGPGLLGAVPKFVLGGVLLYLAGGLVHQWLIRSARRLLPLEYLSLLAIAVIIVFWGFVAGILIGVVIGCASFALSASRVSAIKFSFDGSELRSSLDRGADELSLLAERGGDIQGMALQSYLFFGSANRLYEHVRNLLGERSACRYLIFDFRRVTGIDSSATHSFTQIARVATERGARIVLADLAPELERVFRAAGFLSGEIAVVADLDRALEWCEQKVIDAHRAESGTSPTLRAWLSEALGSPEFAERLAAFCRRIEVEPGDIIAAQGDAASSMHFILDGRVGIVCDLPDGRTLRLRSLGPQTIVGEMGLIAHQPRSATIKAETASVLYELGAAAFDRVKNEHPALSQALLGYVIAVMSERLRFANRTLGVLQR